MHPASEPGVKTRQCLANPSNPSSDALELQVFAPGRARLVAIANEPESDGRDDISLYLKPCRQVQMYLIHVRGLTADLAARMGDLSAGVCSDEGCAKLLDLAVEAGDLLGTAAGPGFNGYDIGLIDTRRGPLPFANPNRYLLSANFDFPPELEEFAETVAPDRLNQFCALDYFSPELRAQLEPLLGSFDGNVQRVAPADRFADSYSSSSAFRNRASSESSTAVTSRTPNGVLR
jgi:hypothetical protein